MIQMNREEIINVLNQYAFNKDEFMILSGASLVLQGVKETTSDIDITTTESFYTHLLNTYPCVLEKKIGDDSVWFIDNIINFSTNYYGKIEYIECDGYQVQTVASVLKLKESLNREKDKADIEKIHLSKYMNQDMKNPRYLFHGSPILLTTIEKRQSHDSKQQLTNVDHAVFLTSSFLLATAYSFKDKIKEASQGLKWNFEINHSGNIPIMIMENVNVNNDISGYVYVFENDGSFQNEPLGSLQYKSYKNLTPISVLPVVYQDYKSYYEIKN